MNVDLSPEVEERVKGLIESGRFDSVNDVIVAALDTIGTDTDWQDYANERIDAGLADIEAGRYSSAEEVLARMRTRFQKQV